MHKTSNKLMFGEPSRFRSHVINLVHILLTWVYVQRTALAAHDPISAGPGLLHSNLNSWHFGIFAVRLDNFKFQSITWPWKSLKPEKPRLVFKTWRFQWLTPCVYWYSKQLLTLISMFALISWQLFSNMQFLCNRLVIS